jgi:hypothetical protein
MKSSTREWRSGVDDGASAPPSRPSRRPASVARAAGDEFSRDRSLPVTVHIDDRDREEADDYQQDEIPKDRLQVASHA